MLPRDSPGGILAPMSEPPAAKNPVPAPPTPPPPPSPSKLGKFIQTYSGFLSSFVIGVAGLIATSIWQYRQSQIAMRQAESEQRIAQTKAENDWRIARAEILAKNLNVLSSQGPSTADQRFGVLLSLTRGSILDPELAVSYALELGKDNAGYMKSVLASTTRKSYEQLANAFALTCMQRFGVERDAAVCKDDRLSDRSDAIAELIHDELDAAAALGTAAHGPMSLLVDEKAVQSMAGKLAWMFEPYVQDMYEKRQWSEIERFEAASPGGRLVAALILATARTGEMVSNVEAAQLEKFHAERRKWLVSYLFGRSCDGECKSKLLDVMLSIYGEADGDFDDAMRKLLTSPRGESGPALARLHARILWCQVDGADLALFRDQVLVPVLIEALGRGKLEPAQLDDLAGLVAMTPDPTEGKALATWKEMLAAIQKADRAARAFAARRVSARRMRADPPPMVKKVSFCNAGEAAGDVSVPLE